jgi:hypothetical protein
MNEEIRTEEIGLERHAPRPVERSQPMDEGTASGKKTGASRLNILALIIALAALALAVQARRDSQKDVIASLNQTLTREVLPDLKKSRDRILVGHIYDLKRLMVTLEEIKETTSNEEVRMRVDQLRNDIEELTVKVFVHE